MKPLMRASMKYKKAGDVTRNQGKSLLGASYPGQREHFYQDRLEKIKEWLGLDSEVPEVNISHLNAGGTTHIFPSQNEMHYEKLLSSGFWWNDLPELEEKYPILDKAEASVKTLAARKKANR